MVPKFKGIDHIHVYVNNRQEAEQWYSTVLGFKRVEKLMVWAVDGGPLMLENTEGDIHLALFESNNCTDSVVAFGATAENFLAWKKHLEHHSINIRLSDHDLAWSMYFSDPFNNTYEITTYDYKIVAEQLS